MTKRSKQLILNPFHGYAEEDRSILNPFMDETIKELAMIDGASAWKTFSPNRENSSG